MPRTVTHKPDSPNNDDVLAASEKWDACKPPYTSSHMKICVAAAKIILSASGVARRSKYEKESYLRIDFSKAGKVRHSGGCFTAGWRGYWLGRSNVP